MIFTYMCDAQICRAGIPVVGDRYVRDISLVGFIRVAVAGSSAHAEPLTFSIIRALVFYFARTDGIGAHTGMDQFVRR